MEQRARLSAWGAPWWDVKGLFRDTLTRRAVAGSVKRFSASLTPGSVVVELGSSRYDYKPLLVGHRLVTVDIDPVCGAQVVADAARLPFESGSVDAVVSVALLEHVPDAARVLQEAWRVCKPGGKAFLLTPFYWREHPYPGDFARWTPQGLRKLAEDSGWTVESVDARAYQGWFFVWSHHVRFSVADPRRVSWLNPWLWIHWALAGLSGLLDRFGLAYPGVYTGVAAVLRKPG